MEALEVLMGALIDQVHSCSFHGTQLRRAGLTALQSVNPSDSSSGAPSAPSSGGERHAAEHSAAGRACCSSAALFTIGRLPSSERGDMAAMAAAAADHEALVHAWQRVSRLPLEGALLEEMACIRCGSPSVSHVTPCLALALPLRTAQVGDNPTTTIHRLLPATGPSLCPSSHRVGLNGFVVSASILLPCGVRHTGLVGVCHASGGEPAGGADSALLPRARPGHGLHPLLPEGHPVPAFSRCCSRQQRRHAATARPATGRLPPARRRLCSPGCHCQPNLAGLQGTPPQENAHRPPSSGERGV